MADDDTTDDVAAPGDASAPGDTPADERPAGPAPIPFEPGPTDLGDLDTGDAPADPAPATILGVSRRRLAIAAVVTALAVPLLAFDDLRGGGDDVAETTSTLAVVQATAVVGPTSSRPSSGVPKGVSVVTSSTTSSTTPLTTTTTTVPGQIRAVPTTVAEP